MTEKFPFQKTGDLERVKGESRGSDVFEFKNKNERNKIYKEIKQERIENLKALLETEDLNEIVSVLKKAFDIAKEYLGDYLVNTYFVIGESTEGRPTVLMVQDKIEGKRLDEVQWLSVEVQKQRDEIRDKISQAADDKRLDDIKFMMEYPAYRFYEGNLDINQILDESGNVRVIDW